MGPDVAMSASMPGYFVKGEDGRYFHSSDVVTAEGPPAEAQLGEAELGSLHEHGGRRRITGKTTMLSSLMASAEVKDSTITVEEMQQRRLRGLQLLMEELDIQDTFTENPGDGTEEDSQSGTDRFIRALIADVEGLAGDLVEEEKSQQTMATTELAASAESQEVFLQIRMFSLAEVKNNFKDWI